LPGSAPGTEVGADVVAVVDGAEPVDGPEQAVTRRADPSTTMSNRARTITRPWCPTGSLQT
jgi:hypothetical protein